MKIHATAHDYIVILCWSILKQVLSVSHTLNGTTVEVKRAIPKTDFSRGGGGGMGMGMGGYSGYGGMNQGGQVQASGNARSVHHFLFCLSPPVG